MIQCMGGWCRERESCAHYHAMGIPGRRPHERLCDKDEDRPEPMVMSLLAMRAAARARTRAEQEGGAA